MERVGEHWKGLPSDGIHIPGSVQNQGCGTWGCVLMVDLRLSKAFSNMNSCVIPAFFPVPAWLRVLRGASWKGILGLFGWRAEAQSEWCCN